MYAVQPRFSFFYAVLNTICNFNSDVFLSQKLTCSSAWLVSRPKARGKEAFLVFEAVSVTRPAFDANAIITNFFSKAGNIYVHISLCNNYIVTPDSIHNFLPAKVFPLMCDQHG